MIRSKKSKIASVFLSLCMVGTMFTSVPFTASAATLDETNTTPTFSALGAVVNTASKTLPQGSKTKGTPSIAVVAVKDGYDSIPVSALQPVAGTQILFFTDKTFGTNLQTPDTFTPKVGKISDVGTGDAATTPDVPSTEGQRYYFEVVNTSTGVPITYYQLTFIRNAGTGRALTAITNSDIVSTTYFDADGKTAEQFGWESSNTTSFEKNLPVITEVLTPGKTLHYDTDKTTNFAVSSNATLAIYTATDATPTSNGFQGDNAVAANTDLTAGTYYVKVTSESAVSSYYELVVANQEDNADLTIKENAGIVVGDKTYVNNAADIPLSSASTTSAAPKLQYFGMQKGTYTISNVGDTLFGVTGTKTTYSLYSDKIDGTPLSKDFSQTLTTGQTVTIFVKVTAESGKTGYYELVYTVFANNAITGAGKDFPAGATLSAIPSVGGTTVDAAAVITVNLPVGTNSVDLSKAIFTSIPQDAGTITYYSKSDITDANKTTSVQTSVGTTSVWATVPTGADGKFYYYRIDFVRPAAPAVGMYNKNTDGNGLLYDANGVLIPAISDIATATASNFVVGGTTAAAAATLYVTGTTTVNQAYTNYIDFAGNGASAVKDNIANPTLNAGDSYVVNITVKSDAGVTYNFALTIKVAKSTTASAITGMNIAGSSAIGTIAAGNTDSTKPTSVSFNLPYGTTSVKASNILVSDMGSVTLYTSAKFDTAVAAKDSVTVANGSVVYAKVTPFSGTDVFYAITVYYTANPKNAGIDAVTIPGVTTTGAVPAAATEAAYAPTYTVNVPVAVTSVTAANFHAVDNGTVFIYTANDYKTAAASINLTNSTTVYAKVISTDGTVVKYINFVLNVVDPDAIYTAKDNGFTASGSMFVTTVTVDRTTAAQLTAPKLLIKYTYNDGKVIYLTQTLTTATADISVDKSIVSVDYAVINGALDWSNGTPVLQSDWSTLAVPQA